MKKTLLAISALSLATQVSAAAFDGFYAGVNAGMTRPSTKTSIYLNNANPQTKKLSKAALTVGVQTGYAVTFANNMFAAGELNFNYDGLARKKATMDLTAINGRVDSQAKTQKLYNVALAAKGGYNFGAGVGYLAGFLGFASYKNSVTSGNTTFKVNQHPFIYGPLVGAEFKVTDTLTAGLEGRMEFSRAKKKGHENNYSSKTKYSSFGILARLNYAF